MDNGAVDVLSTLKSTRTEGFPLEDGMTEIILST